MDHTSFDLNTPIDLPGELGFHPVSDSVVVVVAPLVANWVTLTTAETRLLEVLSAGLTPNEAVAAIGAADCGGAATAMLDLKSLLEKIVSARFFASFVAHDQIQKNVAHLYLTNACNLRCKHCYMKSGLAEPHSLATQDWLDFLREFKAYGGTHVNLSGGEALYYEGFWEILAECKRLQLYTYVLSNGLLVDDDAAKRIADAAYQIQISIDGPTAKSNDSLRGRGAFKKALTGLYHFRGLDVAVRVAMIATPSTIEDYEENFVDFAATLYRDFGDKLQLRLSVDVIEGRSVNRYTPDVKEALQRRVDVLFDRLWGYDTRAHSDAIAYKRGLLNRNCGFGREISVKSTGEVYPCPIQITPIGTLGSSDVAELFRRTRIEDRDKQIDNFSDCKGCDLRYLCGGGCRVANFQMTGDYRKPYFCNDSYKASIYRRLAGADALVAVSVENT